MARKRYEEARPASDVYTGLLAISLLAMIGSCVMLYLDYSQYPTTKPSPLPALPTSAPRAQPQGQLPPPPPLEDRPVANNPVASALQPVSGTETPDVPMPVMPAVAEVPVPVPPVPVLVEVPPTAVAIPTVAAPPPPPVEVPPAAKPKNPNEPPPLPKSIRSLPKN